VATFQLHLEQKQLEHGFIRTHGGGLCFTFISNIELSSASLEILFATHHHIACNKQSTHKLIRNFGVNGRHFCREI